MNNLIFDIKNLSCKYPSSKHPVLKIEELQIEEGSIVFFIGASGVGKSTILETMGLMNNTIVNESKTKLLFKPDKADSEDYTKLWSKPENYIANFRRKHLSFIFQTTNLFNNLSAFNNVSITPLLNGTSISEGKKRVKSILAKILPELIQDKLITEISGGQRQRLAFARAIVIDYTILFADEPTGNLDWANANKLMSLLVASVKQNSDDNDSKRTAVIVSHDIALTIEYADKIVLIEKKESNNDAGTFSLGKISNDSIFYKNNDIWETKTNRKLSKSQMSDYLQTELKNQATENAN